MDVLLKRMALVEVSRCGLVYHAKLGFSLELCHVLPRAAAEGFVVCGLKFT